MYCNNHRYHLTYRCKWTKFYDFHFKMLRLKWNQDWIMTRVHWGNYYFRFCFVPWANFTILDVGSVRPSCSVYFILGGIVRMVHRKLCQEFINFQPINSSSNSRIKTNSNHKNYANRFIVIRNVYIYL